MTSHEILGFMSPTLSGQILDELFVNDKALYRGILGAVANARKLRPQFLEKQSRAERHPTMVSALSKPAMDEVAGNLIRGWLLKKQTRRDEMPKAPPIPRPHIPPPRRGLHLKGFGEPLSIGPASPDGHRAELPGRGISMPLTRCAT